MTSPTELAPKKMSQPQLMLVNFLQLGSSPLIKEPQALGAVAEGGQCRGHCSTGNVEACAAAVAGPCATNSVGRRSQESESAVRHRKQAMPLCQVMMQPVQVLLRRLVRES